MQLDTVVTLSAMRIWNYSKSREHSYRGARRARFTLDSTVIFDGEIRKAVPGLSSQLCERCEVLLFTLDEELVRHAEATAEQLPPQQQQQGVVDSAASAISTTARPLTAELATTAVRPHFEPSSQVTGR